MYLSISRAEGPVDIYRFLNTFGYYLCKYFTKPYKNSYIYALVVGKPFFFLFGSAFLTLVLREREQDLKEFASLSDLEMSLRTSIMIWLRRRVDMFQFFSFYSEACQSESFSSISISQTCIFILLFQGDSSQIFIVSLIDLSCSLGTWSDLFSSLSFSLCLAFLPQSFLFSYSSELSSESFSQLSEKESSFLRLLSSASLRRSFSSEQTMSKFQELGSLPSRNSRVSKSKLICSSNQSIEFSLSQEIILLSIFSEVDFLISLLELVLDTCLLCPHLSISFMLQDRQSSFCPSLIGKLVIFSYQISSSCFFFEMVAKGFNLEEGSSSRWKMSASRYYMYFLESYSSMGCDWSEEVWDFWFLKRC